MGLRQISMKKETDLSNLSLFTLEQEPAISNPSLQLRSSSHVNTIKFPLNYHYNTIILPYFMVLLWYYNGNIMVLLWYYDRRIIGRAQEEEQP